MYTSIFRAFFLTLGLFFLLVQTACTPSTANTDPMAKYLNQSAPDFSLQDYEGNTISLEGYRGKYLVIHIATTWCPFCNAEAPYLQQLSEDYDDQDVEVIIIDVKEDKDLVKEKLIDQFKLTFPVLFDTDGQVAASFAPPGILPDLARDEVMLASNLLIDPEGNIKFFSLLDTNDFDASLVTLKSVLDELL
ncbi:MAG: TlpA disulfide reductase family protein [Bacteroidota bacterium]